MESENRPMLRRLWDYQHHDITTWKYIDYLKGKDMHGRPVIRKWIRNPRFAYEHLDTGNK